LLLAPQKHNALTYQLELVGKLVKEVERSDNWSRLQTVEVERKQKQEDVRLNLLFIIHRLSFFLPKNRWLYWILVITLCVLLGATLALITPLWVIAILNQDNDFLGETLSSNSELLRNNSVSIPSGQYFGNGIDPFPVPQIPHLKSSLVPAIPCCCCG